MLNSLGWKPSSQSDGAEVIVKRKGAPATEDLLEIAAQFSQLPQRLALSFIYSRAPKKQ
jgi:hypothetical protein